MILVVSILSNYIHGHAPVVEDSAALDNTVAMVSSSNVNTSPVTGRDFRDVDDRHKIVDKVATQETGYTKSVLKSGRSPRPFRPLGVA
jgi:hypothetical protein